LLDEVTSQLDAANERALKETIRRVSETRAVVVIAHRVVEAGKIILLEGGRISAEGTHERLLEVSPTYKKLVQTQMIEAEDLSPRMDPEVPQR
jgi:ABC-type multidrug transport system fused ATPase/permease subunit